MSIVSALVRLKFNLTSRKSADQLIRDAMKKNVAVAGKLVPGGCKTSAKVPKLLGVDENMLDWNFYQILEHNVIVNRRIAESVLHLVGKGPQPDPNFSIKHDVIPSISAGVEQIEVFEKSVEDYLQILTTVPKLRGTETVQYPIFGPIDAHKSRCLFGFHLQMHRKQAEALIPLAGDQSF